MPKLFSSAQIIAILKKNEFVFISQKGSHIKYRKQINPTLTVIIPADRKEIPIGTFQSIPKQSGLTREDFER